MGALNCHWLLFRQLVSTNFQLVSIMVYIIYVLLISEQVTFAGVILAKYFGILVLFFTLLYTLHRMTVLPVDFLRVHIQLTGF